MVCMFSGRKQFTTQITCIKLEYTDFKNFTYNFISLRYILARAIREKASAAVSAFAKDKSEPAAKRAKKAENRLIQIQNWIGMILHKMSIILMGATLRLAPTRNPIIIISSVCQF